jgi:hypothetical protein
VSKLGLTTSLNSAGGYSRKWAKVSTGALPRISPADARDASLATPATTLVDLRSPDARDATRLAQPTPVSAESPSGGFDWTYVAVGGGAAVLLLGAAEVARRRRAAQRRAIPV